MKKIYFFLLLVIASLSYQSALCQTIENIVGWTSWTDYITQKADQGISGNINTTVLSTTGGTGAVVFSDVDGNGTSQRAYAPGWDNGANTKAWQFQFSTTKYSSLTYSCRMSGTNDFFNFLGPRDFKLQYSCQWYGMV